MSKFRPQYRRLIFIDSRIRRGDYPNASDIAREYEVSSRTILRDIEYMKVMLDAPIAYDAKRNGYRYTEPSYMLPAIVVSESDLFALCIAEKALAQYAGTTLYGTLEAVFRKLASCLPAKIPVSASWLGTGFSFIPDSAAAVNPAVWETVSASLRAHTALEIEHRKAPGEVTRRVVRPYHVAAYRGEWYLFAHCERRREVLRFALSRITAARSTGERYEIPADFDFTRFMGESFGIWDEKESFTARILFSAEAAPYAAERCWHPHQSAEERPDGTLVLSFPATSRFEVKRWVLSWGAGATVLGPPKLAAEVRDELDRARKKYETPA
jgi:proteasome accessory factor B